MIYLNNAGTSFPKPRPVHAATADALAADPGAWSDRFDAAHRTIAGFFGIEDPGRLLPSPGCTSALAVGIADHPWQPGDKVVVSGLEHHAVHRPALKLQEAGIEVVVADSAPGAPLVLESLEEALRAGGVRLVAMTAASNVTGEILPYTEAARLAHAYGALFLLDAAQIAGWVSIDVQALGVDLLAFAGHKGPQGPWGIGGLYVAPHVAMRSPAAHCAVPDAGAAQQGGQAAACASMPGYCDVGGVNRVAMEGLAAAIAWLNEPAQQDRLVRARGLAAKLSDGLAGLAGVTLHGSATWEARVPTVAFTVAGRSPGEIAAALLERGAVVSGGLQCAPLAHETLGTAPLGVVRASVGPSSSEQDVKAAIEALRAVLRSSGPH